MTQRYTLSAQARQDLKDIKDYIAQDSLDRAEQFVKAIAERFKHWWIFQPWDDGMKP
jgi:plasmid stabilization system protein ParE